MHLDKKDIALKKHIPLLILISLVSCFLTSCGETTNTISTPSASPTSTAIPISISPTPTPTPDGYLRSDDTGVRWLQWTEANGQITGLWNTSTLQNGKIIYTNGALSGTHNGDNISLIMKYLGQEVAATGTLKNNVLSLQTPGDNGHMLSVTYYGASKAEYDKALATFKTKHK
jgi:hypothetical protein